MQINPKVGMLVILTDSDNQDQVAVIQDVHINGTRFWITLENEPHGNLQEVMIRCNGAWKTKKDRRVVELTLQNVQHNYSLDSRTA